MMKSIRDYLSTLSLLLALLGLAACATSTGCDPARAGFVESLNCSNGGFQGRQAYLEQNAAAAQANALEQRADAGRAAADANAAQRDLAARRRALARLDGQLAEMRSKLQATESRPGVDQTALQRASLELDGLQRQRNQISRDNPIEADLRAIEDRQRKVLRALNDL